jgi:hypothetical protein
MRKNGALKIVNPVIALLLLCQICTAMLMITLGSEIFETIHKTGGILLAAGGLLHLSLNWNWVKASYFGNHRKP